MRWYRNSDSPGSPTQCHAGQFDRKLPQLPVNFHDPEFRQVQVSETARNDPFWAVWGAQSRPCSSGQHGLNEVAYVLGGGSGKTDWALQHQIRPPGASPTPPPRALSGRFSADSGFQARLQLGGTGFACTRSRLCDCPPGESSVPPMNSEVFDFFNTIPATFTPNPIAILQLCANSPHSAESLWN